MSAPDLLSTLAAGIRRCRKAKGLTIEKLAEKSGIDAGYLAHIEVSAKKPSLKALTKIARGLDVPPEELFWTEQAGKGAVSRRIDSLIRRLPPSQQQDVLSIVAKLRRPEDIRALKVLLKA
jgi:transcriptional regulator with XRE-family HTH domain